MKQLLIYISLLLSTATFAQDRQWTMQECMQYAVAHNPKVDKKLAQNSIYHQDYLQAIGALLPKIDASTSAEFAFGRGLSENNTYIDQNSFANYYRLTSSLTIFDGLSNINTLRMQRINKAKGKYELQNSKDEVAYQTMEAYLNVLYYKGTVQLGEQQLNESREALRQAQRKEEVGLIGFPDLAEAVAKEAEDAYNLTRQKNIYTIGIILLKEKMNFPIDENINIADYDGVDMITKTIDLPLDIYTQSVDRLPQAQAAKSEARASEFAYRAAKGAWSPRLSVEGGITSNFFRPMGDNKPDDLPSFKSQLLDKRGEYVGMTLSIPIFTGFQRTGKIKKSQANMVIARSDREETLRKIYSDIEQAVADMNGQVDEYTQAEKQAEAMTVAHKVNQRKYDEGLVDAIQVSTTANRMLKAKVEALNARYKYVLKAKLVDYYKGIPYIAE